ncbi:MAG TPA: DUF222 domain-containing protein [Pseudolysinimonas sp.]|nr:DUF222 domain-containing protein [Pseudolysinimonas sp.]
MTPFGDVLEHATRALESAPSARLSALGDDELLVHLADVERLGRLVDALRVAAAGEVDARSGRERGDDSLSRHHQCTSAAQLVELITGTSSTDAARRVRVGRAITPLVSLTGAPLPAVFEHVAAALSAGRLGVDAAAAIIRHLTEASRSASPATLREAEAVLVQRAETLPADLVAQLAQRTCATLDPDGVEPRENELRRQRRFYLGREVNGMTPFSGLADPVNAGLLRAALSERTAPSRQPRFVDADDRAVNDVAADGAAEPGRALDGRTREQRAFDIVFGLLTAGIRSDNDAVGTLHGTATVNVVVTAHDLIAGTGAAWIDDIVSPVATATTREIICDGGVRLQIHDRTGEILWEGRRERYFTAAQRRALAVRDGGCLGPHCTAPPSWCHAHHVVEWEHGGPTDVDNGVLLCSFHHHQLHAGGFRLRMNAGVPEMLAPPWLDRDQLWRPTAKSRLARAA